VRRPIGLTVPYREVGYKEKRDWVGLTAEEVQEFVRRLEYRDKKNMVLAIEKLLKDKNDRSNKRFP